MFYYSKQGNVVLPIVINTPKTWCYYTFTAKKKTCFIFIKDVACCFCAVVFSGKLLSILSYMEHAFTHE